MLTSVHPPGNWKKSGITDTTRLAGTPITGKEMDSSIMSGLIGGVVSVALVTYLSYRLRAQPADGTLRWGWGLILLGSCCLAFVGLAVSAFFYDDNLQTDKGELLAAVGLIVGFGLGATYCFAEYFLVRGTYDDQGVEFYTPWTGSKVEKWQDLQAVKFNAQMSWYVLQFKSGKTIRLSTMLSGHGGVIEQLDQLGVEPE